MPIISTPPPASGVKRTATVAPRKTQSKTEQRTEALNGLGQLAQVPLIALKQFADAGAIGLYWPNISNELAKLAESQEVIGRLIDPLIQIGPYTGLVTAVLPLIMQIGVNHGRVAPGAMGTVPASALSAQVEASLAQTELAALTQQKQAEEAASRMRKEINDSRRALADAMQDHANSSAA